MDDIYNTLLKENSLKREKDIIIKKKDKEKKKKMENILKKIYKTNNDEIDDYNIMSVSKYTKSINLNKILEDKEDEYLKDMKIKYNKELVDYKYIRPINIEEIKPGGYLRYIDMNENLKWGGIVLRISDINNYSKCKILLKNTTNNIWKIKFSKYYIFYKNNITLNDKIRKIFLSQANLD